MVGVRLEALRIKHHDLHFRKNKRQKKWKIQPVSPNSPTEPKATGINQGFAIRCFTFHKYGFCLAPFVKRKSVVHKAKIENGQFINHF